MIADVKTSLRNRIPELPARIERLAAHATNLAWSWSREARAVFKALDEPLWHLTRHNPIDLLRRVDPELLAEKAQDPEFLRLYDALEESARRRAAQPTWYAEAYPEHQHRPVAYFCAEFGFHNSVPIYSGGLGVLAGDHCKAASDLGVPLVGVGLFYMKGYFDQKVTLEGWQQDGEDTFDPLLTPLAQIARSDGKPYLAVVKMFGRPVYIGVWRMMVGRVPIYLLDTNLEENHEADRVLSSKLYAGGPDLRIAQEWILGAGGVRVLRALGIHPAAWHANEGHAAFMLLERVRELTVTGVPFDDAVARVRRSSVFTTHTPVPAGHDTFWPEQIEHCIGPVWQELGLDRDAFLNFAYHAVPERGVFHMTVAAIRLSARVNAVSRRHGDVSRRLWQDLWPDRPAESVPIGHLTNGVHLATWMSHPMQDLLDRQLGTGWEERVDEPELWERILELDDEALWSAHQEKKVLLLRLIRDEARRRFAESWKESAQLVGAGTLLDPNAFTIGFARRFATYKRANLLFHDLNRLRRLLVNPWRPVQLVFAGKAHPADTPGKEVLQSIYRYSRDPWFQGRIAFLEDYDLHLSHFLVQGVDLWLNLPRVPMEACGTSGMKAALNAVPQLSTLDGWWDEGYDRSNGWAITPAGEGEDGDRKDAEECFALLEEQIVPLFYRRDERGLPRPWLERMKNALRVAGSRFTARLMVKRYAQDCYAPAIADGEEG